MKEFSGATDKAAGLVFFGQGVNNAPIDVKISQFYRIQKNDKINVAGLDGFSPTEILTAAPDILAWKSLHGPGRLELFRIIFKPIGLHERGVLPYRRAGRVNDETARQRTCTGGVPAVLTQTEMRPG
ncbi:hypothetical protein [uncultured Desulfovibrio sp.]|uniref:hypothetical protein n=1 Tax=uncultured Desulfovibrio sp. TaxID=167968 RepID=UPI0026349068|nr:hypothetical protein [uncultured Desulfovibrio sp.]